MSCLLDTNMLTPDFRRTVAEGLLSREGLHAEIADLVSGRIGGRGSAAERVLIHTVGLVSQDVALCHFVYTKALETGRGRRLPLPHRRG